MRFCHVLVRAHVAVAVIAACACVPEVRAQDAIYLVRHAERLDDTSDPPLAPDGTARAARLAALLQDAGVTAVFATQYRRTFDTAKPLADALGLPVSQVTAGQHGELLARVRAAGPRARVLIVGHSDTIPELLALLGDRRPIEIAKAEYDNLFIVVPGGATPLVVRLRY